MSFEQWSQFEAFKSAVAGAPSAPKTWGERQAELARMGIDPHGQLAGEWRIATAPERAEWRTLVVQALLLAPGMDLAPRVIPAIQLIHGISQMGRRATPGEALALLVGDRFALADQVRAEGADLERGAALLALSDVVGLGGRRGLEGLATVRIPQLGAIPSKNADCASVWTAEVARWADRAAGLYLRPVLTRQDDSLRAGLALLGGGEALDLSGATRKAFVGLAGLPSLPDAANPTAGHELPAVHVRAVALNAALALLGGHDYLHGARLAPEDLPIWSALADLCALLGEDGPAYSGIWRSRDTSAPRKELTLERVQSLLHDHKPAGEVSADDDDLDG